MHRPRVVAPPAVPLPPRAKLLRPKGQGTVSHESDGFHARGPAPERHFLGVFLARELAEEAIDRFVHPTLDDWLERFLRSREAMRYRNVKDDRSTIAAHVGGDPLGALRLAAITPGDGRQWLQRILAKRAAAPAHVRHCPLRKVSAKRVANVLTLVRCALQIAVDEGHLDSNPFRELRVPRATRATAREEFQGVLDPDEQTVLLVAFGEVGAGAVMLRVALGLGLRKNELRSLEWPDVFVTSSPPFVVVRRGTRGGPTKGGKPRRLPLFGVALEAMMVWRLKHPHGSGLCFPGRRGHGKRKLPVGRFRQALTRAHIERRVCWHDLRHTCGTSLLMGWWGRKWSVVEVQRLLGHASPATTERYLHARNELIFQAASEMRSRDADETWLSPALERPMGTVERGS